MIFGHEQQCANEADDGAPRHQKARKVGALSQLRDVQPDGAGPRLARAVALGKPQRGLLAVARAGGGTHFQFHQPLGGEADRLAQQIGVRGLLHERTHCSNPG